MCVGVFLSCVILLLFKSIKHVTFLEKIELIYNFFFFVTQYTGNIINDFENMQVNIDNVVLLDEAGRKHLLDFNSSGIDKIDYDAYLAAV